MDIKTIKERHEADLLRLPNVVGVGIGVRGHDQVIKVFVTRKIPRDALGAGEMIPETLEGYPVDVDEVGTVTAGCSDSDNGEGGDHDGA